MEAMKTVLSAFIGIGRRGDGESAKVNPVHIIILAVIGVVLFIFTIRTIVRLVVS